MNRDLRAGHPTAWATRGSGDRAALFIHCSLASGRAWTPVMDHLDDALSMTAFDLPGHGRSADWDGAGDVLLQSAAIAEAFCDGPVDLVGHSFGGVAALRLAVERPDLVRTMTLVEPVFFGLARGTPEHDAHQTAFGPFYAALEAGRSDEAARLFAGLWGGGASWSGLPDAQRQAMIQRIHLVRASVPGLEEDSGDIGGPGRLEAVTAPVLLVTGERTQPVVAAIHRRLAARLPDAREAVVAGAGHMAPLTHPREVAALIRESLRRA